jgi:hypothetical protein
MPQPKKGLEPISKRKGDDDYSQNPKTKRIRDARQELEGIELLLSRADNNDRKAKFDALKSMRASAEYRSAANQQQKQSMEDSLVDQLFQDRYDKGVSGNVSK